MRPKNEYSLAIKQNFSSPVWKGTLWTTLPFESDIGSSLLLSDTLIGLSASLKLEDSDMSEHEDIFDINKTTRDRIIYCRDVEKRDKYHLIFSTQNEQSGEDDPSSMQYSELQGMTVNDLQNGFNVRIHQSLFNENTCSFIFKMKVCLAPWHDLSDTLAANTAFSHLQTESEKNCDILFHQQPNYRHFSNEETEIFTTTREEEDVNVENIILNGSSNQIQ